MPDRQHLSLMQSVVRRAAVQTLSLVAGILLCAPLHAAPIDVELAYTYDDNVARAQFDDDIFDDRFLSLQIGTSVLQWFNANNRVIYRGFLRAEVYDEFETLSNGTAGLSATYQYRGSGAFTSPTYGAFIRASINEYKESDLRDSDLLSVGVSFRKPFTDRIVYTAQLSYNMRESEGTVWDTKDISLLQNLDYAIADNWTVYFTYNYLDGDIVSSTSITYGVLATVNAAEEINIDDAFDSLVAYRLDGNTNVITLGTNFRLNERNSFDLSARWAEAKSTVDDSIKYERWIVSLAYLTRF